MTKLDDLREKVDQKRKIEKENQEIKDLETELEKGTIKGVLKKAGKGLFKKLIK